MFNKLSVQLNIFLELGPFLTLSWTILTKFLTDFFSLFLKLLNVLLFYTAENSASL